MSLQERLKKMEKTQRQGAGEAKKQELGTRPADLRTTPVPTGEKTTSPRGQGRKSVPPAPAADPHMTLKTNIHKNLIEKVDNLDKAGGAVLQEQIAALAAEMIDREAAFISRGERERILQEVVAEAVGYGPIHPLLQDPEVSEVMVNGPTRVYVERKGRIEETGVTFRDDNHVLHIIEKIVAPLGRRIDESMPMVDARLPDGSRVNAIIPPLALNGPTVTIRKFSEIPLTIDDLISYDTLTPQMARFLRAAVAGRLNMVVSGGTGSGKTTTLNVLSSFISDRERIVTIEDAAEIKLSQEHIVTLEARLPNAEGKGEITIRDLVRNSLRMRPDRIVIGEVRSGEALDMLQAMNTGHDGSLTTGHANSPRDMLARLETMVLMAGMDLPVRAIREQIASAIDIIVHQGRLKDGSRKVTHVTEVQGMEGEVIVLQDIFLYNQEGVDADGAVVGGFQPTGILPKSLGRLQSSGEGLGPEIFEPGRTAGGGMGR